MPELPEVETVVRGLNRLILKKKIAQVKHDWPKSFPNLEKDVNDFMIGAEIHYDFYGAGFVAWLVFFGILKEILGL